MTLNEPDSDLGLWKPKGEIPYCKNQREIVGLQKPKLEQRLGVGGDMVLGAVTQTGPCKPTYNLTCLSLLTLAIGDGHTLLTSSLGPIGCKCLLPLSFWLKSLFEQLKTNGTSSSSLWLILNVLMTYLTIGFIILMSCGVVFLCSCFLAFLLSSIRDKVSLYLPLLLYLIPM